METHPYIIYEAHSTDYQTAQTYQNMVCNHFAIIRQILKLLFGLPLLFLLRCKVALLHYLRFIHP
ncbi:MAG: class II D-tagatose-bisphosphate aldolase non-catalytic subunit [Candidatus Phlomobacter fragariae]